MVNKNNVIAEIKELIQQIKSEYQEGTDFKVITEGGNKHSRGFEVKSPRLKKVLREKFDIAILAKKGIFLDYHQSDLDYWFTYRIEDGQDERENSDSLLVVEKGGSSWNETENCKQCNQPVVKREGWINQWNGRKKTNEPSPNIIAHFHPQCAKKYFAGKEQPNENSTRIKEKILRNLDKISFDQAGHLANAELLRNPHNEYGTQQKEKIGVYRIKIDSEEINLRDFDREENEKSWFEIRNAIVNGIKQNISDWEIKKDNHNNDYLENKKNGVKVWKVAFCELVFENGKQDWTEIEELLKGSKSSASSANNEKTETNNLELEWLKNLFQELKIKKLIFKNGKLTIEFNNQQTTSFESSDNQKYKILKNYCQKHNKQEITRESLNLSEEPNNSTNSNPNNNNQQLVIGLVVGASVVALIGILVYFGRKRRKGSF